MQKQQIHFLTGRLAENALRETLKPLAAELDFDFSIQVMPISVAALMTPKWIANKIEIPRHCDRVIVPGYCQGELQFLSDQLGIPVEKGPKDLRTLAEYLGGKKTQPDLTRYSIEIIAEINHAPKLKIKEAVEIAKSMAADGANLVDIGCIPGHTCQQIGDYVRAIANEGIRVSIDSLNVEEINLATAAGAELVLSVNQSNLYAAPDWGTEVVVIPDDFSDIRSLTKSIEWLDSKNVDFRIDPILEPIGLGFAKSLNRYFEARKLWPNAAMMMGIGNLTELSDVDSAGINFLLLGYCEELNICSILTTQVINWARTSVAECNIARRLVHFACQNRIPPKNISDLLVRLRDPRLVQFTEAQLESLRDQIKDHNYRIFADSENLHLLGSQQMFSDIDPFKLFDELAAKNPKNLDASHAFYLGYEMCKAMTAMQLGKNYVQDESLDWGHLTVDEKNRHRLSKRFRTE